VKGTKTGIHCVSIRNGAGNRSYVAEYTIDSTNTWEYKTITIPVDTTGTWLYDTGKGVWLAFTLINGSTRQTSADTWTAGDYVSTSNQVNALDSTSNTFKLALVQLEAGSAATTFDARSVGTELALCQRYYQQINTDVTTGELFTLQCYSTTIATGGFTFPVMRATPTGTVSSAAHFALLRFDANAAYNCTTATIAARSPSTAGFSGTIGTTDIAAGNATSLRTSSSSAQIRLSAEL
jgi:hypothetical protein